MGLELHLVSRDNFEVSDIKNGFDFPCCVCVHRHGNEDEAPCNTCDHNANAEPPK